MTISSTTAMLAFADLGIGNGLINVLSDANGRNDHAAARQAVSSAFVLLSGISASLAVVFAISYGFIDWSRLFNVTSSIAAAEAGPTMIAFAGCFFAQIIVGIVPRLQIGYQDGFLANCWSALGSLLGLAGVLVVTSFRGGLPLLVISMSGGPLFAGILNGIYLLGWQRPALRPTLKCVSLPTMAQLLRLSALFLVLQIASSFAFASDNFVAARIFGAASVADYSVAMRLLGIVPMIIAMLQTPLWPAYGEAIARGDEAWVRRTLVRSLLMTAGVAIALTFPLVMAGSGIMHLWVGDRVHATLSLLLGMGLWSIFSSMGSAFAMYLNGANVIRFQAISALLMASAAFGLKVVLAHAIGLSGIIWGTVIAYGLFTLVPCMLLIRRTLR